jgi:Arc/MetJ-type ribon-helix-helix transcriptional regulator
VTRHPKDTVLSVRISHHQLEDLRELAWSDRRKLSDIIRDALAEHTSRRMSNLVTEDATTTANHARLSLRLRYAP